MCTELTKSTDIVYADLWSMTKDFKILWYVSAALEGFISWILTSNWSSVEVGALRKAKKEFWESWCLTPTDTEQNNTTAVKYLILKTSKSDLKAASHRTALRSWGLFHMTSVTIRFHVHNAGFYFPNMAADIGSLIVVIPLFVVIISQDFWRCAVKRAHHAKALNNLSCFTYFWKNANSYVSKSIS